MKKKIVFVMHELSSGGAERVVLNLVNNFDRHKFDIHLCLFKKTGQLIEFVKEDIIIHDLNVSRVYKGSFKFMSLLLSLRPDFVFSSINHVNQLISSEIYFLRLFLKNTKFIARQASIASTNTKNASNRNFFYKITINNFDKIIAQSRFMKEDLIRTYKIDNTKIEVVNNPLDISTIKKCLLNIGNEKIFSPESINILAIGSIRAVKNYGSILEAIPQLNKEIHLNIIGESREPAEKLKLDKIISDLNINDRVTFHGFQKNPYKFIKDSNLVVLTSLYEGFPNVILESNVCGKFVVAFNCPGVNSEIIKKGINGILVENNNIEELAKAINSYSKKELDTDKIIKTTDRYHVKKIVKEYEQLLLKKI